MSQRIVGVNIFLAHAYFAQVVSAGVERFVLFVASNTIDF